MTWLLQTIFLLLTLTLLKKVFDRIHDLGVRRAVAALSRHPAVFCILGSGSYFEKRTTSGLPEADLTIVLKENVSRADAAADEIAHTYERVRRIFPFLGRWQHKEGNLIFLSDLAAGFPAPESFRVRFKQGRLAPLYGELPGGILSGTVTTSELLTEINGLLRFSLVADPRHAQRLVFWKHVFVKLSALAELLDLTNWSEETWSRTELTFLAESDRALFFRKSEPDRLFSLQLALSRQIFDAIAARETKRSIRPVVQAARPISRSALVPFPSAVDSPNNGRIRVRHICSVPIGLTPRLLYSTNDTYIPLLELGDVAYNGLQRLRHAEQHRIEVGEKALVSAEGFLFIATRQTSFVDVVPLDPLQYANVYAAAFADSLEFEMPASILAEQVATAAAMFRGLAHMYRVNDGTITKFSHPCIYREHDAEVIENALRLLRVRAACGPEWRLIQSSSRLFEYLRQKYPECEQFLRELQQYERALCGDSSPREVTANNLYHCLNQFMYQALTDTNTITVDPTHKHLDITVGVITRNRAADLAEMLDSLTRQLRKPDEVLVVDNGSSDHTQAVVEGFRDRLPIRCQYLERADIPGARNLVLESASHEIVSFVDDDCITEPEWLAGVEMGFLRAENIGIVGGWTTHQPAPRRSTVDNYYRAFHNLKS
jgi:hypothetical protein